MKDEQKKLESFADFRKSFFTDSNFQKKRILYPLPFKNNGDYIPTDIKQEISINSDTMWNNEDLKFTDVMGLDTNKFSIKDIENDSLIIETIELKNSGFFCTFYFILRSNSWYLKRYEESSL